MWENAQAIELWIRNLGSSHSNLVKEKVIPALPLKRLYEDSHSLEIEPCNGVELTFWFETQRLEAINITLISQDPEKLPAYSGKLPAPFNDLSNYREVHAKLGEPFKNRKGMSWEQDDKTFSIGGWDFYELDESLNSNCQVEFQYDEKLNVSLLTFSVFDRES
jgi:hypothetical protein